MDVFLACARGRAMVAKRRTFKAGVDADFKIVVIFHDYRFGAIYPSRIGMIYKIREMELQNWRPLTISFESLTRVVSRIPTVRESFTLSLEAPADCSDRWEENLSIFYSDERTSVGF